MPAVVVGTSDPYTESTSGLSTTGNGYHCRFYLALTKHIKIGSEKLGLHLSYLYNQREDYHLNGPAFGVSCNPSFDEMVAAKTKATAISINLLNFIKICVT